MKQKYVAMVLGMAVTLASMGVCAAEAESTEVQTEPAEVVVEGTTEGAESGEIFWGEVTAIDEDSITVTVGELAELSADAEEDAEIVLEDAADDTENASEDAAEATDTSSDGISVMLIPGDETQTIAITDETQVYFVYGNTELANVEDAAAEFTGGDAEVTEVTAEAAEEADADVSMEEDAAVSESTEENAAEDTAENAELTENIDEGDSDMEETMVDAADVDGILEGDLVGIILDQEGNASTILVVLPESEVVIEEASDEVTEDAAEEAVAEEDAAEVSGEDAVEIISDDAAE